MKKLRIGRLHVDYLGMSEAVDLIVTLAGKGRGGYVVTPNVDHVVMAEKNDSFRRAYEEASVSLADGAPLVLLSRLLGEPLPEKVSGSDLVRPLLRRAALDGLGVYFMGSAPGVGLKAAGILEAEIPGLKVVGVDSPPMGFDKDPALELAAMENIRKAAPDLVLVALGAPKQELLMHAWYRRGLTPVMLGIGASLDFIAGAAQRAPAWVSRIGFEWLHRLLGDPRRLFRRYIIQDSRFLGIMLRTLRTPRSELIF